MQERVEALFSRLDVEALCRTRFNNRILRVADFADQNTCTAQGISNRVPGPRSNRNQAVLLSPSSTTVADRLVI